MLRAFLIAGLGVSLVILASCNERTHGATVERDYSAEAGIVGDRNLDMSDRQSDDDASQAMGLARADISLVLDVSDPDRLHVSVQFQGTEGGRSHLDLDEHFGFVYAQAHWFSDISAACQSDCRAVYDERSLTVTVDHAPSEPVTLLYTVDQREERLTEVDDYRPVIRRDGVALFPSITVFLPTHLSYEGAAPLNLTTRWTGTRDRGWRAFGPFGPGASARTGRLTDLRLRESLFAAGPNAVIHTMRDGAQLGLFPFPGTPDSPDAFLALVEPALAETRAMFADVADAGNWYFIAYGRAGPEIDGGYALGGTAVTNAFSLYYSPDVSFGSDSAWMHPTFQEVVAHEYFHTWNGVLFYLEDPDLEFGTRWFVEGFTDYYARQMIWRSGLISDDRYARFLNDAVQEYLEDPDANRSNAELAAFWAANDERAFTSYVRGRLIAFILDEGLRQTTDGQLTLDGLMRYMAEQAVAQDWVKPHPDIVFDWIEREASAELAEQIRRYIDDGGPLNLPNQVTNTSLVWDESVAAYRTDSG